MAFQAARRLESPDVIWSTSMKLCQALRLRDKSANTSSSAVLFVVLPVVENVHQLKYETEAQPAQVHNMRSARKPSQRGSDKLHSSR